MNYSSGAKAYNFPHGQLYRFDLLLVVAVWIKGKLHFSKIETFLRGERPEFRAFGDELGNNTHMNIMFDSPSTFAPLEAVHSTGKAIVEWPT
jgi:hypothetical protein